MFYLKVIRQIVSRGPLKVSIEERKQTHEMESRELDQSEAPPFWPHGLASVSVALLVETDMIVYKSRAKQLRRQTISITTHIKKQSLEAMCYCVPVWPRWVMVFISHWWLNVVRVIEVCTMGGVGWWGHFLSSLQARALVKLGMSRIAAAATATTITRFQSPSLSWGQWEEENEIRG